MPDPQPSHITTEAVLNWLDGVHDLLPGNHPVLLAEQFQKIKEWVVAHAHRSDETLKFSSSQELFAELGRRHEAAAFIGSQRVAKNKSDERYVQFTWGPTSSVLGLSQISIGLIGNGINMVDEEEL